MTTYLGKHLTVDGVCGEAGEKYLSSFSFFYYLLENLPKKIDMVALCPPYVLKYLDPPDISWGLTGFIIISTSHISFHTFPEKRTLHFDCFSCKPFREGNIVEYLDNIFGFVELKVQIIDR